MTTQAPQHPKQGNNFNNKVFLLMYIMLNAMSTSGLIRSGYDIANGATDKNYIIGALMWLGCTVYTAQRAIELYKKIYNNQDKQK